MDRGISTGGRPTRGTTDPADRQAWLALALVPGLGSRRLAALIAQFGSATAALRRWNSTRLNTRQTSRLPVAVK